MNSAILFYVSLKVRPSPSHPSFYDWQFGFLEVFLFADSVDDAAEKAAHIASLLPYELKDDDGIKVVRADKVIWPTSENDRLAAERAHEQAAALGLGFYLVAVPPGADETAFDALSAPP